MFEEGRTRLQDADVDRIEGTRFQFAQIMADRNNGLFIDKGAIRIWMKEHIHYPISYLDFEWETLAYPPYKGMKPFEKRRRSRGGRFPQTDADKGKKSCADQGNGDCFNGDVFGFGHSGHINIQKCLSDA